jgi:hypothetical protein
MKCKHCGTAMVVVSEAGEKKQWACHRHNLGPDRCHRQFEVGSAETCWCPLCDMEREANHEYPYRPKRRCEADDSVGAVR